MATITVTDHPELTDDRAIELFRSHFSGKYEVPEKNGIFNDFVVKKSDWHAVGVRFRQGPIGSTFSFAGFTPSWRYRMLPLLGVVAGFPGVLTAFAIMFLALRPRRKEMEEEIARFIQNDHSDLAGRPDPVPQSVPSLP